MQPTYDILTVYGTTTRGDGERAATAVAGCWRQNGHQKVCFNGQLATDRFMESFIDGLLDEMSPEAIKKYILIDGLEWSDKWSQQLLGNTGNNLTVVVVNPK